MSSTAFSSDSQEVLSRQVESTLPLGPSTAGGENQEELRGYFEIARCVEFIKSDTNLQRVALQFPDFLLRDAARVTSLLSKETGASLFVLGDTSYGSCCVDEVAAEHMQADCIIHFGPGCLTQTRRLPVLYVFGRESVDVLHCVSAFRELYPDRQADILVLYDTMYAHCIDEFRHHISSEYLNCVVSSLVLPEPVQQRSGSGDAKVLKDVCACSCGAQEQGMCGSKLSNKAKTGAAMDNTLAALSTTQGYLADQQLQSSGVKTTRALEQRTSIEEKNVGVEEFPVDQQDAAEPRRHKHARFGRTFELGKPVEEYHVFYIGFEGPCLTNLILNYNRCQFCSYNPVSQQSRKETINVNKALGRRYFLVQKAKEARTVGILVGTLGAADYLGIMERLKKILKQALKKYYTIAVGKLNVAKMANFMEIDIFVLVACPENSLVDSQEFYKPVVTPFEMEVACLSSRDWSGDCVTDYQELFPGAAFHVPVEENSKPEEPEYSLITGSLLPSRQKDDEEKATQADALVPRSKMEVALQSSAAEYLRSRSWQGLKQRLGESEVSTAVEGTTGIAASYTHESEYNLKEP